MRGDGAGGPVVYRMVMGTGGVSLKLITQNLFIFHGADSIFFI